MIKIGLVGVGHLGKIHLRIIKGLPHIFDLIGIFDVNTEMLESVASEFNVKAFETYQGLLHEIEALDVVTPTLFHFSLAEMAINQGKHVFIEKPITQTLFESQALLDLCQIKPTLKVQVGHVERFNPAFVAAKPFLNKPEFIETHRLAQFNPRGTDVPVVLDLMIHDIDIILFAVDSEISNISASGVSVVSPTHDITNARLEFENGTVANLTASRISMKNMRKSRFFQRDAYVGIDFLNKSIEVVRIETIMGEPDPYDMILDFENGLGPKKLSVESPKIFESNAIEEELREFASAIQNNTPISVDFKAGHKALEVAYKILEKVGI